MRTVRGCSTTRRAHIRCLVFVALHGDVWEDQRSDVLGGLARTSLERTVGVRTLKLWHSSTPVLPSKWLKVVVPDLEMLVINSKHIGCGVRNVPLDPTCNCWAKHSLAALMQIQFHSTSNTRAPVCQSIRFFILQHHGKCKRQADCCSFLVVARQSHCDTKQLSPERHDHSCSKACSGGTRHTCHSSRIPMYPSEWTTQG